MSPLEDKSTRLSGASTPAPGGEAVPHGGDLDAARRAFPQAPEPWIDLSTAINPDAYPIPELPQRLFAQLPQTGGLDALLNAAARRYRAGSPRMIVAAPGTQALIGLLPRLVASSRVAVLGPTYAEHAAAWRRERHHVCEVDDLAATAGAKVVVVVNPNNPTGRIFPRADLAALAERLGADGGQLVVDEAFADLGAADASLIPDLPASAIVLRSFGKTYGLAGLRLGFAIAAEGIARRLREMLGPWAVPGPAIAIGTAALADDLWLERTRVRLEAAGQRLDALLLSSGCTILGGAPLFRLVAHPAAPGVADALAKRGILVRRFGAEPTWLRFGIPGAEPAWERLEDAIRAVRATIAGSAP
jgi:cobalamin biosynthetic protein CobC